MWRITWSAALPTRTSWPPCSEKGELLVDLLEELNSPHILEVRGEGLMVGVQMDIEAAQIMTKAYDRGLLVLIAGPNVLRFVPPLVISEEEIKQAVAIGGRDFAGAVGVWVKVRRFRSSRVQVVAVDGIHRLQLSYRLRKLGSFREDSTCQLAHGPPH